MKEAAKARTRNQRVVTFDRDAVGMVSGAALALARVYFISASSLKTYFPCSACEKARFDVYHGGDRQACHCRLEKRGENAASYSIINYLTTWYIPASVERTACKE